MSRKFIFSGSYASYTHVYVVDVYSLDIAFGLYKMSATSTNAVRVRRASDNAEQDIGFSGYDLDNASLSSFIGSDDAFIVKWYNQGAGGATYDISNTNAATQPLIALGGVLYTLNGKTSILLQNRRLNANLTTFNNKSFGASISVIQNNTTNSRRDLFSFRTNSSTARFFSSFNIVTLNRASIYTRRLDADAASVLTQPSNYTSGDMIRTDIIDWANNDAFIRINNTQVASSTSHGTSGSTSATNSSVAGLGNIEATQSVDRCSVWVVATTDISANISNIENDINNYYGIY